MSPRIPTLSIDDAPATSAEILSDIQRALGMVPNLHKTLAHAPAALQAYTAMAGALSEGVLPAKLRESIAIATAARNNCQYCASAHTLLGKGAGLSSDELGLNLEGKSTDPKVAAVLGFVTELIEQKGSINDFTMAALRDAGISPAEIAEIIAHVGMNSFTNLFNVAIQTEIDFPIVELP